MYSNKNDNNNNDKLLNNFDPHGLPEQYKQLGWRKCFSNREKRYYYFNKYSNQSIWSLHELFELHDIRKDPLGICTPQSLESPYRLSTNSDNISIVSSLTPRSDNSSFYNDPIRRLSQNENYDQYDSNTILSSPSSISSPKRFATSKHYWNLKLETNVLTYERAMDLVLPPNQDIEIIRNKYYLELKNKFECLLKEYMLDIIDQIIFNDKQNEIKNLFNYLTIELKFINYQENNYNNIIEPLIISYNKLYDKSDESYIVCYLLKLFKTDIDRKIQFLEKNNDLLESCIKVYREYICKMLNYSNNENDDNEINNLIHSFEKFKNDWFKWSNVFNDKNKLSNNNDNDRKLDDSLKNLKKKCENYLIKAIEIKLKKIFNDLNKISNTYINDLHDQYEVLYRQKNIKILTEAPNLKKNRKVIDYPLLIATASTPLPVPNLEHDVYNSISHLTYDNEKLFIKTNYFVKLEQLYKSNCKDDENRLHLFLARVWCLLKRYQIFNNELLDKNDSNESNNIINYQLYSLNPNVIDKLTTLFSIRFEIFSNPFTCYFKQFCSFFDDTDGYFGSRGSFLNYKVLSGSFLAILPVSIILINSCLKHIINLLSNSNEALMFTIVLPLVVNDKTIYEKLTTNEFCKNNFKLQKNTVEFRRISEYTNFNKDDTLFKCNYDVLFVFLQNKEAEHKWPITENNIEDLKIELMRSSNNLLNYSP